MTAYRAQTITSNRNLTTFLDRCNDTEDYVAYVLYSQITLVSSLGRNKTMHLLPNIGLNKRCMLNKLAEDGYRATIIGKLLFIRW